MSITIIIIVFTCLISIQAFSRYGILERLKHYPYVEIRNREWYRLLTSGFVHGGWVHLIINMLVLFMFGEHIEKIFESLWGPTVGRTLFLVMYLMAIVVGDLPTLVKHKDNPAYASIGASGAVSAVVFIFILLYPWEMLYIYGIVPVPALLGGIGYLIYSSWASRRQNDRIDHLAHFYGAVFGVVFMIVLKPQLMLYFIDQVSNLPF
jgi:membrane associated rhomboid family serine protease